MDRCETEAYGMGAAALLPWAEFFGLLNSGSSAAKMAEHFDVSLQLIEYRIKITRFKIVCRAPAQARLIDPTKPRSLAPNCSEL